jgi:hypothetical protein
VDFQVKYKQLTLSEMIKAQVNDIAMLSTSIASAMVMAADII